MSNTRLSAPNGVSVSVDSSKVEELQRRGFTAEEKKPAPRRTSTTSKSSE